MKQHETLPRAPMSPPARRLRNLFFIALSLLVLLNAFIYPHDPHFGLDRFPGFWALFGLAGAVILAKGAKGLAHTVLGKPEDYYEPGEKGSRGRGFECSGIRPARKSLTRIGQCNCPIQKEPDKT